MFVEFLQVFLSLVVYIFSVIDLTTDKIVSITDRVVEMASGIIGKIFKKRNKKVLAGGEENEKED